MTQAPPVELVADQQLVHASLAYHFQDVPGLLSICSDKDGWAGRRFTTDEAGIEAATQYALKLDSRSAKGVYAQVTTLRERPAEGRGGKELAHGLTFLWADGDFGDVGHKPGLDDLPHPLDADHVREIVAASGLPEPSGWWLSGGGYNPIWVLAEPYIISSDDDRAAVEQFTMGLQAVLGGSAYSHGCSWDTQIGNLDRLMRIPGTVNRKAEPRATASLPGTGEPIDLAVIREAVQRLEPDARALLEKAAAEKRDRHAARTGRATVPPPSARRSAFPRSGSGTSVFDILATELTFRDVLEPEGWTYRGTAADGREKWLRPAGAEGAADSDYSLVCDDHVAVNWSERSDLPVGQQPAGRKLTVPTLWAHIHYGGNEREAALDVLRAAFGQDAQAPARALSAAVLGRVRQHGHPPAQRRDTPPPPTDDIWADFDEHPEPDPAEDDAVEGPATPAGLIPEEFYAARPELQHIRQAGHSRSRSGDVALLSVLTRLSSLVSHRIRADTGIAGYASLNLFGGIIGPSGIGKSTGVEVADRLMPAPPNLDFRDGLPLGSGEGLAEVFMGIVEEETGEVRRGRGGTETPVTVNVRKQVRHNAFFYVDEGATITRLMKERSGSTLGETLRSAAVGQTLGQTNASKDTSRYIPSGSYSLGLLVGFQPETVAPLFEEVAEGTPQRFVWVQVIDPSIPDVQPAWPGELHAWRDAAAAPSGDEASRFVLVSFDESIKAELRAADLAKVRGLVNPAEMNQFDSQAPVMRVKLASLLAILAGRRHVNVEDWQLALMLWQASCATRDAILAYSAAQRRLEQEKRTTARIEEEVRVDHAKQLAEDARTDRAVERLALRLAVRVRDKGPQTRREIRDSTAGRDKRYLPDAYAYAVLREWVVEEEKRFVPGPVPPS
ncbi:putative phage protein [Streptomyces scabiei 87.22]|uniref:Putative phage protein n=1 Tax=Streptomyces scabiei (strain 87.22) TaxID=680198 RepID=C9ZFB6_STRSW|nr:hypothetical protein [Streptomyces scabiei]MDX2891442.1 hypothetical protein [Streptomyces scabiei]MDX2904891.1 hypothetical protein [Streptomyces scabiei]MDX2994494.1 hypothetical protein [Streptomyces scabiei]MDX3084738.1 hypothetical protein [Streptomyces scabiei]MDX3137866.1 hypothetical protein [Streptomyces scabiei]